MSTVAEPLAPRRACAGQFLKATAITGGVELLALVVLSFFVGDGMVPGPLVAALLVALAQWLLLLPVAFVLAVKRAWCGIGGVFTSAVIFSGVGGLAMLFVPNV